MNSKLSIAIASILGSVPFGAFAADQAAGSTDVNSDALQEITVTATRRSQSIQDVPISIQAFTTESLQQLNIQTFDDYVKFLPNVTTANNGPGQNEVYIRGLSAGTQPSQGSGSTGLFPNVAIYLDNQSGQLPNRNLDIYAADIDRIEVLEGLGLDADVVQTRPAIPQKVAIDIRAADRFDQLELHVAEVAQRDAGHEIGRAAEVAACVRREVDVGQSHPLLDA